jgi:hypothetical protein
MAGITGGGHVRIAEGSAALDAGIGTAGVYDTFGWGDAGTPETAAPPNDGGIIPDGGNNQPTSFQRKTLCTSTRADMIDGGQDDTQGSFCDSDNNSTDFIARPQRKPHNSTMKAPANSL